MNKLVVLSVSFVLFILIILPLGLTMLIRLIPGGVQPPLVNTKKIYDQFTLSQGFVSPEENLTGIGVSIKNPNFANKKRAVVNIFDDSGKSLRTIHLNGQNIADGKFVKILFEPIINSKNKKFIWSISSPESNFEDALEVFLTDKQPTWSLTLRVNDKVSDQGLSYVTLHRPSGITDVLNRVVRGLIYKIKGDSIFFISYSLLIVVLFISVFAKFPLKNLKKHF